MQLLHRQFGSGNEITITGPLDIGNGVSCVLVLLVWRQGWTTVVGMVGERWEKVLSKMLVRVLTKLLTKAAGKDGGGD